MEARLDICFDLAFRLLSYRRTAAVVHFSLFDSLRVSCTACCSLAGVLLLLLILV
jgi:hypothetical protein